jgi:fumarylacetoacetase
VRSGSLIVEISELVAKDFLKLEGINPSSLEETSLNHFLANDRAALSDLVFRISDLFATKHDDVAQFCETKTERDTNVLRPIAPGDFIDFYASLHHARKSMQAATKTSADPLANWFSMPVGYHSRTATIQGPNAKIIRPNGQVLTKQGPQLRHTRSLDFELELGFVFCGPRIEGQHIATEQFENHVFGLTLLNDWSARDFQGWESKPLGPFLSKSFATQVGPWIVPLEALSAARRALIRADEPLPYLNCPSPWDLDINLKAKLETNRMRQDGIPPELICQTNFQNMYWNVAQQLSHASINGATMNPADLFGSGTVSGEDITESGCMLERTMAGTTCIALANGEERRWLEDGDRIDLSASCEAPDGTSLSFGTLSGTVTRNDIGTYPNGSP